MSTTQKNPVRGALLLALACPLLGAAVVIVRPYWASLVPGHDLNVKVEGAVVDRNFRDAGASFNACAGRKIFRTGRLFRAAVWFSGWSCDAVGNPDVMYTLNYKPENRREYFCRGDGGARIGRHFNDKAELNDLEMRATWDDAGQRTGACAFFADSFAALARGDRVLVHCDAGRDRTGTYAALAQALVTEAHGPLDDAALAAIECDYRKSETLNPVKYGRMERFLRDIKAHEGSVRAFFIARCQMPATLLDETAAALSWPVGQDLVR